VQTWDKSALLSESQSSNPKHLSFIAAKDGPLNNFFAFYYLDEERVKKLFVPDNFQHMHYLLSELCLHLLQHLEVLEWKLCTLLLPLMWFEWECLVSCILLPAKINHTLRKIYWHVEDILTWDVNWRFGDFSRAKISVSVGIIVSGMSSKTSSKFGSSKISTKFSGSGHCSTATMGRAFSLKVTGSFLIPFLTSFCFFTGPLKWYQWRDNHNLWWRKESHSPFLAGRFLTAFFVSHSDFCTNIILDEKYLKKTKLCSV